MHYRQYIRDTVYDLLSTDASLNIPVLKSQSYNLNFNSLPAIIIYTLNEESNLDIIGRPSTYERKLTLNIDIYSGAGSNIFDDEIDHYASIIEKILAYDAVKYPVIQWCYLTDTNIRIEKDSIKATGSATLSYIFEYRTLENNPDYEV